MNNKLRRLLTTFPAALLLAASAAQAGDTTLVSVSSTGQQGNSQSGPGTISADGRFVAFHSSADNLVTGDTNGMWDVFVHDRVTGKTSRISVSSTGKQGNNNSGNYAISADGRFVAFVSWADNLVRGDMYGTQDVFVHDRATRQTTRVSVSSAGQQGNGSSYQPAISADGRFVAFISHVNTLVAGDTNEWADAFVHDRVTGQTTRVSVSSAGQQGNGNSSSDFSLAISADGRFVAFVSDANNLVGGDSNGARDIFVHDRVTGKTSRVSVSSTEQQGNGFSDHPAISADGRFVAFESFSDNLVDGDTNTVKDAFVHDRLTGQTTRVNVSSTGKQGNKFSFNGAISADGRFVTFFSSADNLIAGGTVGTGNVFVHDRLAGKTTLVSVNSEGQQVSNLSLYSAISADGRYVAFLSYANNLVAGDTNGTIDVFVRDRLLNNSKSADLKVAVTAKPASLPAGQTASYTLTVKNNGPDRVGNIALTDVVANGKVRGMTPSQGTCSQAAVSVCRIGTLAAGASATVAVKIKANADPLKQQLSVSAAPLDNVPGNNAVTVNTQITP